MRVHTKIVALHKMYPEEVGRAVRAWSSTDTLHNHRKSRIQLIRVLGRGRLLERCFLSNGSQQHRVLKTL